jgi:uncharacterized membrane protein required for colicin V production
MNVLDWVLIIAFAGAALWGFKTGLVSAALNALSIYAGLFLSGLFAGQVLSLIWDGVESQAVSTAIGYVIIFAGVFIASRIVASMIKKALKVTFMSWIDSFGGIVVGLVAGVLISGGVMTVVARYSFVEDVDATEIGVDDILTDGTEGITDKISGNTIAFAKNLGQDKGRGLLLESTIVPYLINARSVVTAFAPAEFDEAIKLLEQAIDEQE